MRVATAWRAVRSTVLVAAAAWSGGCEGDAKPVDALAAVAAELDAAVVAGRVERIREHFAHQVPGARAMAAQAAAAAGDWESMPKLIELLDDDDAAVRARAAAACASLLGMDHGHEPHAAPADRAKTKESVSRAYETMRRNPPPQYRD